MWGCMTPEEAQKKIKEQQLLCYTNEPRNLEEMAINLVGTDIYRKLIQGYTEKQWGRPCSELPCSIIQRLPLRFTFDNNYFNAVYQGIPESGYTDMIANMLDGIEVQLNVDYVKTKDALKSMVNKIIYTGPIDEYFDYCYGPLQYRSLRFETEMLGCPDYQGNAVVNYTDPETPYTRIIEHKHFLCGKQSKTVISREYSVEWEIGMEPYYPISNDGNSQKYNEYKALASYEDDVLFGGRMGDYKYYDMDMTISKALESLKKREILL